MALNYTAVFGDVGTFIKGVNELYTFMATTLPAREAVIEAQLEAGDRYDLMNGLPEQYAQLEDSVLGWIGQLGTKIDDRFTHESTVVKELPLDAGSGVEDVWAELYRQMITELESFTASEMTVGTAAPDADNKGDGVVFTNKVLDGVTAPMRGAPVLDFYAYDLVNGVWPGEAGYEGTASQLGVYAETITLTCSRDSESDGTLAGGEHFEVLGYIAERSPYDYRNEGSGAGTAIQTANAATRLVNGAFETWTEVTPDEDDWTPTGWDVDAGDLINHIVRSTDELVGAYALGFLGDGVQAAIKISQDMLTLTPLKRYFVGCWVKGQAGIAAGTLTIQMEGTGYAAGTAEKIEMDAAALAAQTAYGEKGFFFTVPQDVPDDFELVVKITGTLTDEKNVVIDELVLMEPVWHGGVAIAILPGALKFIRNDRFTFTLTNDDAGAFQTFFRKWWKFQLPTSDAPTIDDALAVDAE